jgi:hypothetical protein
LVIIFNSSFVINIKFNIQYTMSNLIINLFLFVFIDVFHSCSSFIFMAVHRAGAPPSAASRWGRVGAGASPRGRAGAPWGPRSGAAEAQPLKVGGRLIVVACPSCAAPLGGIATDRG